MLLEKLLSREEGKTLEFKEGLRSLTGVVKTVAAFANTAGGYLVIGVEDRTKRLVGLADVLKEEERIANVIATSIHPLVVPEIEVHSMRNRELLLIRVHRGAGPYRVGESGPIYVRMGSTNRRADAHLIEDLERATRNETFDELPCLKSTSKGLDWKAMQAWFSERQRRFQRKQAKNLNLVVEHQGAEYPSIGAVLLCGRDRDRHFPDAELRCVRFLGTTRSEVLDHQNIGRHLPDAIEEAIAFVRRNTRMGAQFGELRRKDIPEYPARAVREVITNAVLHADYGLRGSSVQVAIFDDRMEVTNPGALPIGLSLEDAIDGASRLRNRVIGRFFRELELIEQWGSGFRRIRASCAERGLKAPLFQEMGTFFRVTLYNCPEKHYFEHAWEAALVECIQTRDAVTVGEAAEVWGVTPRTARSRLAKMCESGRLFRIATAAKDPRARYSLPK